MPVKKQEQKPKAKVKPKKRPTLKQKPQARKLLVADTKSMKGSDTLPNDRQERFAQEFLVDMNRTQAAIRAGYSKKTAMVQGSRVLNYVQVLERVEYLKSKRQERMQVEQDQVIDRLLQAMNSNVANFVGVNSKKKIVTTGKGKGRRTHTITVQGLHLKDVPDELWWVVESVSETNQGLRIKMLDKIRPMELLGRHFNMFGDEGGGGSQVLTDDEFRQMMKEVLSSDGENKE